MSNVTHFRGLYTATTIRTLRNRCRSVKLSIFLGVFGCTAATWNGLLSHSTRATPLLPSIIFYIYTAFQLSPSTKKRCTHAQLLPKVGCLITHTALHPANYRRHKHVTTTKYYDAGILDEGRFFLSNNGPFHSAI
jgi:hypothetical protein